MPISKQWLLSCSLRMSYSDTARAPPAERHAAGLAAQVGKHPPSKHEAPSSHPSTIKKKDSHIANWRYSGIKETGIYSSLLFPIHNPRYILVNPMHINKETLF